jgi:hypothetical protein
MTRVHRIAACLVIAAQAILALAVPASAVHGGHRHHGQHESCGGHAVASEDRLACRSPAGTWVLGLASDRCHDRSDPDCLFPAQEGDLACFDCADAHSHLHVANVDDIGDGGRRWSPPPAVACGFVTVERERGGAAGAVDADAGRDRSPRPPPSSRRALGSIVLRV